MEVRLLDTADAAALSRWNDTLRRAFVDDREGVWWDSDEAIATQFSAPKPGRRRFALIATDGHGEILGAADVAQDADAPAEVSIGVLSEHRRRGVGTALWQRACELLTGPRVIVQSETSSDAGVAFAESVGLAVANREHRMLRPASVLAMPASGTEAVGIRTWTDAVPEDLVADWARLSSRMGEDVPLGALTRITTAVDVQRVRDHEQRMSDQGWILLRSMAVAAGAGIGYSVMFISAAGADVIVQDDTFVESEHRGWGVARALKTANLRALAGIPAAASARWIQTWTAVDNQAMLALNQAMGFEVADTMTAMEGVFAAK